MHKSFIVIALGVCVMIGYASIMQAHAAETFRDGKTWCGDPDAVQAADNPYVKIAERNVTRALQYPDVFWYTWGYAAPESSRKGDAKLRELVMKEMESLTSKLAEKPSGYWELLTGLECIRLLQRVPDFPADTLKTWLERLRPSVESNYQGNTDPNGWTSNAPNTLHQSAAILQLASLLYHEPRYAEMAKGLVKAAGASQEADGAFRYLRNSGPSQIYYGFDSTFLGRYYQLSQDPLAKAQLINMAKYSQDALANGLFEASSTPWWKHHWATGGPLHGVEIIAGLSRDPLSRAVAELRLNGGQPYFYTYYPMFFWDPTIPKAKIAPDLCRYNSNVAGPQIRHGAWQVVMPGKAYADTGIGCSVVSGEQAFRYDGYLETAALPVLMKGVNDAYHRPGSLLMSAPDELTTRATLVGKDWIASGWSYQPRALCFGDATAPSAQGWRLAQVWFADENGFAGWLTVRATVNSPVIEGPRGYVSFGEAAQLDPNTPTRFNTGKLALQAWGDGVKALTPVSTKEKQSLWIALNNAGERAYSAGEQFGYGLSGCAAGQTPYAVKTLGNNAQVVVTQILRRPGETVLVAFNAGETTQEITLEQPVKGATLWLARGNASAEAGKQWSGNTLQLRGYELAFITR